MKDWFMKQHIVLRAIIVIIVFGVVSAIVMAINNVSGLTPPQ